MATAFSLSYSADSGAGIHAGRYAGGRLSGAIDLADAIASGGLVTVPSALSGGVALADVTTGGGLDGYVVPTWMPAARTWAAIPSTVTLASLDITGDSNYMYPTSDWIGQGMANGAFAWTTHVWDEDTKTWYCPILGGHTSYGGNEPYKVSLAVASTSWQRIRLPSGAKPGPDLVTKDGQEANGTMLLSNGKLRAHHTYHNARKVPGVGLVICRATGAWFYPAGSDTRRAWVIDTTTGEATERANWHSMTQMGNGEGSFDYDPVRDCLWALGCATSTMVQITNLQAATWTVTKRGAYDNWLKTCGALRYIPGADKLAIYPSVGGSGLGIIDPATNTAVYPSVSGSFSAGYVAPDVGGSQPGVGFEWCVSLGCFLIWNNSSNTTQISTLTPSNSADLSQPWVRGVLTVSNANAVTPPVTSADGVFGRMTYSPGWHAVLLHVASNQPFYAFKL